MLLTLWGRCSLSFGEDRGTHGFVVRRFEVAARIHAHGGNKSSVDGTLAQALSSATNIRQAATQIEQYAAFGSLPQAPFMLMQFCKVHHGY